MSSLVKIWLPSKQLRKAKHWAAEAGKFETGGLLLGYRTRNGDAVVQHMTPAGVNAKATPISFRPDYDNDVRLIASMFEQSDGITTYLGDWHTHPNTKVPYLSEKDLRTLKRVAVTASARNPEPLSLVLAGSSYEWVVGAWIGITAKTWFGTSLRTSECQITMY